MLREANDGEDCVHHLGVILLGPSSSNPSDRLGLGVLLLANGDEGVDGAFVQCLALTSPTASSTQFIVHKPSIVRWRTGHSQQQIRCSGACLRRCWRRLCRWKRPPCPTGAWGQQTCVSSGASRRPASPPATLLAAGVSRRVFLRLTAPHSHAQEAAASGSRSYAHNLRWARTRTRTGATSRPFCSAKT